MTRTRLITATLTVLLTLMPSFGVIAGEADAVVGTWNIQLEFQGQTVDVTLEVRDNDGILEGTWTGPRGSSELSDMAWNGETLTFARHIERQGQQFSIDYTATIEADSMQGKMITPRGELPFEGERAE